MTSGGVMRTIEARPLERFEWTLLPLTLIAYGTAVLSLLAFAAQAVMLPAAIGSTSPILLDPHSTFQLPATAGTHHYFGSAYIPDGVTVTGTGARADVAGISVLSRMLLPLGPLLWSATISSTATAIGLTLSRFRRPDTTPLAIAVALLAIALIIRRTEPAPRDSGRPVTRGASWRGWRV